MRITPQLAAAVTMVLQNGEYATSDSVEKPKVPSIPELIEEAEGWLRDHIANDRVFEIEAAEIRLSALHKCEKMTQAKMEEFFFRCLDKRNNAKRVSSWAEAFRQRLKLEAIDQAYKAIHPLNQPIITSRRYGRILTENNRRLQR